MQIVMDKSTLLARLKEQRKFYVEQDKAAAKIHREKEKEHEKKVKDLARQLLKMSYKQMYQRHERPWGEFVEVTGPARQLDQILSSPPSCPIISANRVDDAIKHVELSEQKRYTISKNGVHSDLYEILTFNPTQRPKSVCDDGFDLAI